MKKIIINLRGVFNDFMEMSIMIAWFRNMKTRFVCLYVLHYLYMSFANTISSLSEILHLIRCAFPLVSGSGKKGAEIGRQCYE